MEDTKPLAAVAIAGRRGLRGGVGPAQNGQAGRIGHGNEAKDTEHNVTNFPKPAAGNSLVMEHRLYMLEHAAILRNQKLGS